MSLSKCESTSMIDNQLTINDLPNEILFAIMQNLSIKEKMGIERVCKKWQQVIIKLLETQKELQFITGWPIVKYAGCKHHQHHDDFGNIKLHTPVFKVYDTVFSHQLTKDVLSLIMKRCTNIKNLYLSNCHINIDTFLWLLEQCPHMECLSLIEISGFQSSDWPLIKKMLGENLIHLAVSDSNNFFTENILDIIPQLHHLTIYHYSHSLVDLFSNLGPNLTKLSIKNCENLNVTAVKTLMSGYGTNVTDLEIDDPWLKSEAKVLELICDNMKNLVRLSVAFGAKSIHVQPLLKLKNLKHLELTATIERWSQMLLLSMPNIESLLLNAFFGPSKLVGIEKVFPNCQKMIINYYCQCDSIILGPKPICSQCKSICLNAVRRIPHLTIMQLNGMQYEKKPPKRHFSGVKLLSNYYYAACK